MFPDKELAPGNFWDMDGQESQDFRQWGIPVPFILPLKVRYLYLRDDYYHERPCAIIQVHYFLNFVEILQHL